MKLNSRSKGNNDEFLEACVGNNRSNHNRFAILKPEQHRLCTQGKFPYSCIHHGSGWYTLRASIQSKPINVYLICVVAMLYVVNNNIFKQNTSGFVRYFFTSYFNDLLCPILLLAFANLLLMSQNYELKQLKWIVFVCFLSGMYWEYITPLYMPASTSDVIDIVVYLSGACIYWLIYRQVGTKRATEPGSVVP